MPREKAEYQQVQKDDHDDDDDENDAPDTPAADVPDEPEVDDDEEESEKLLDSSDSGADDLVDEDLSKISVVTEGSAQEKFRTKGDILGILPPKQ